MDRGHWPYGAAQQESADGQASAIGIAPLGKNAPNFVHLVPAPICIVNVHLDFAGALQENVHSCRQASESRRANGEEFR